MWLFCLLDPGHIYIHPNQIPGYAPERQHYEHLGIWKLYHSSLRRIQVSHPNISEVSTCWEYKVSSTQIIRAAEDRLLWHQIVANVVHPYSFTTTDPYAIQQFLGAISHSLGAYTAAFDVTLDASDAEDDDDDHQQQSTQQDMTVRGRQRSTTRSLPHRCMHWRRPRTETVALAAIDSCCPIGRSPIQIVLRVSN